MGGGGQQSNPAADAAIAQVNAQNQALQAGTLQAAQNQQLQSTQSQLSSDTLNLVKMFGARAAMSGAGISAPFTSAQGGLQFLTQAGGLVGARS